MVTNNPLALPNYKGSCFRFAGSRVQDGILIFSDIALGYRAAIIFFIDRVVRHNNNTIRKLLLLPLYYDFDLIDLKDYFNMHNVDIDKPFNCIDDLLLFISLMAYKVTRSRVNVDTLRLYCTQYGLYSSSSLLPRYPLREPIQGS